MKFYCDMFIPFMPDSEVNEEGKLVPSETKQAGRKAMIELDAFQNDGNIAHLYNSVVQACLYAKVDVVDTLVNLPEDIEIPNVSIQEAVNICAKLLFKSVNPNNGFELDKFICILLTASHFAIRAINAEKEAKASEVTTSSEEIESEE